VKVQNSKSADWHTDERVPISKSRNLGAAEHNSVLKMIGTTCRHSQESVPVLDRDSPLPRLQEVAQFGFCPRYPFHNIVEMTTRPFCISERSSAWVGVIRIAVAVFDCDIQIA
jgi:hypothetical protein